LAEGQQTFVTYRRAHGRFLGGGQALSFDLGRWADVRAAREFVVTVAKIPEEKFEVTGKEYPKDESPVLKGLEWGEADGKTRCRLRLNQRVWQEQETPVVLADVLHRGGGRGVSLRRSPSDFELELNGVWYSRQGKPDEARWRLAGRHNYDEAIAIPLDGHWQSKEDGTALQIADGRHTVRLAFVLECLDDPDRLFRAVSGPVQIFCGPRAIEAYEALQEDGQKILGEMVRANRHWLIGPPETVKTYAYDFVRWDKKRVRAQITVGANVASSSRQGIRFRIPLHALANEPSRAVVTAIERQGAHIVLRYDLGQATKAEIGNGHRPGQTWRCCRSYYASRGAVWVDASRHVPVRTEGRLGLEIRFLDYVSLGEGGYAPKRIRFKDRKSRWGWRFATYSPGLWLFERGGPRYGMIGLFMKSVKVYVCNVTVNGQPARPLR